MEGTTAEAEQSASKGAHTQSASQGAHTSIRERRKRTWEPHGDAERPTDNRSTRRRVDDERSRKTSAERSREKATRRGWHAAQKVKIRNIGGQRIAMRRPLKHGVGRLK